MYCNSTHRRWESPTCADLAEQQNTERVDVPWSSLSPLSSSFLGTQNNGYVGWSIFINLQHLSFSPFQNFSRQRTSKGFLRPERSQLCAWHCPLPALAWCGGQCKKWNATWKWEQKFQGAAGCPGRLLPQLSPLCTEPGGRGKQKQTAATWVEIPSLLLPFLCRHSHLQSSLRLQAQKLRCKEPFCAAFLQWAPPPRHPEVGVDWQHRAAGWAEGAERGAGRFSYRIRDKSQLLLIFDRLGIPAFIWQQRMSFAIRVFVICVFRDVTRLLRPYSASPDPFFLLPHRRPIPAPCPGAKPGVPLVRAWTGKRAASSFSS